MGLTSKRQIKQLLASCGTSPSKRLGQNFLVDAGVLRNIVSAADLSASDTVLEIGPGMGTLTLELAKIAKRVIAVEKDQKMMEILRDTMAGCKNVEIIRGDALRLFSHQPLSLVDYKIVANLPYYIVSPAIRMFLEAENPPKEMILMVQKEVAQRICAKPPSMSMLGVSVQFYATPKIIRYVDEKSFWPRPKVGSAIIKISQIKNKGLGINPEDFFRAVKAGFAHPRKQLIGNISGGYKITKSECETLFLKSGLDPKQRAETLAIADWLALAKNLSKR